MRQALLELPLSARERQLLDAQARLTGEAVPIQNEVIDLLSRDRLAEAADLRVHAANPAQYKVVDALSRLAEETQRLALAANQRAQ